jgi:hypothetical protein
MPPPDRYAAAIASRHMAIKLDRINGYFNRTGL